MIRELIVTAVLAVVATLAVASPVAPTAWTVHPRPAAERAA